MFKRISKKRTREEADITLIARRNTDPKDDEDGSTEGPNGMIWLEAHRTIIGVASGYFSAMIDRWTDANKREETIRGVDPKSFEFIIKFIYNEVTMPTKFESREELVALIQTADLLLMDDLKDVTLIAQTNLSTSMINAHIAVLRDASPYFAALFSTDTSGPTNQDWPNGPRPEVTIPGVDPDSFELIIQVIYQNFLTNDSNGGDTLVDSLVSCEQVMKLLDTAHLLQMDAIKELGFKRLVSIAEPSNVCTSLRHISRMVNYNNPHRRQLSMLIIDKFPEVTSHYHQNAQIDLASLKNCITNYWKINLINEQQIYTYAIDCWVLGAVTSDGKADPARLKHVPKIYGLIDF